jgi:uncharacterized protein (TIGR02145 family)
MKRLFTLLLTVLFTVGIFSQVPEKMSYQAVVRNSGGLLVRNGSVGIRITIYNLITKGNDVYYEETHTRTTNNDGLVTLEIGGGTMISENPFSSIDWSTGPLYLGTAIDPEGGSNYTIIGASQILTVPYALYAKKAESLTGTVTETDPIFVASPANGINSTNIGNWNTAFGWGNHVGLYRASSWVPSWTDVTGKSNTLAGYGITDAVNTTGNQTIGGNKTFTGTTNVITPVNPMDAATKAYVDALKQEIHSLTDLLDDFNVLKFTDNEGTSYKVIKIGTQVWMAENLKSTKLNDGTDIPLVTDGTTWGSLTTPGYCFYNNDRPNYYYYGGLYNWYTVNTGKLCPVGWHVPTDADWTLLTTYLGGESVAGGKLKNNFSGWNPPNTDATNETRFSADGGGLRYYTGAFDQFKKTGFWWSSTENSSWDAWRRIMGYNYGSVIRLENPKRNGFSVRCLRGF